MARMPGKCSDSAFCVKMSPFETQSKSKVIADPVGRPPIISAVFGEDFSATVLSKNITPKVSINLKRIRFTSELSTFWARSKELNQYL